MPPSVDERLIRIETLLEGFKEDLRKGENNFNQIKVEISDIKSQLVEQDKQLAYWKGALAFITFVWPLVVKFVIGS